MAKHTPTPWRVFKSKSGTKLVGIGGQDGVGILDAGFGVWSWNDPEGIANAEMVVKAVNNHDKLVKALSESRAALIAFKDAVEASQKMNGREYVGLGIQINDAIGHAWNALADVGGVGK